MKLLGKKPLENTVKMNRKTGITSIITDVRFTNEVKWIKEEGGVSIFLEREGTGPTNPDEVNFTDPLRSNCDLVFKWKNLTNFKTEGKALVREFLRDHNICHLTLPTNN